MNKTLSNLKIPKPGRTQLGMFSLMGLLLTGPAQAQYSGKQKIAPEAPQQQVTSKNIQALSVTNGSPIAVPVQVQTSPYRNFSRQAMAAISSTAAGGNWSSPATWVGGVVPTATDDVTIVGGATVTIDANAAALSVTIAATGSLVTSATTNFKLEVGSNLTNNGTLDLSNSATIGSDLRFVGAGNAAFSGTGTTDLHTMSLAKAVRADVVEMNLPTLSVKGSTSTGDGFLFTRTTGATPADDMTGTLKISGTATISNKVFGNAPAYIIPATGAFWLNNPNFTVAAQNGSPTVNGLLRVSAGTFNVGTATGNSLAFGASSILTMEGGTINTAGRIGSFTGAAAAFAMTLNMSGGTINVATIGNASGTPSFGIGGTALISGGTINLVQRSTAATPLDYYVAGLTGSPVSSFTGGTVNAGTAATATNFDFRIRGSVPGLTIDNTGTAKSVLLAAQTNIFGSVLIPSGTTLNLNGFLMLQVGPTITNNGTLTATATGSRLYFQGNAAQSIGGTGVFTNPIAQITIQNSGSGVTFTAPIITRNIAMFQGNVIGAGNITLGNGAAAGNIIQYGVAAATTPAGNFDVAPLFNIGTGYLQIIYAQETVARTTGVEIPANRTIDYLSISNTNGLTVAGGNLTILGEPTISIFLTAGIITTSPANKIILGPLVTTTPTGIATSYIKGPLGITVNSTTATSRTFAIGDAAGWRPVVLGGITTTAPQIYTATVISGATGGSVTGPISSLNPTRYVRIENTTNLPATATVQLSYGADDVIGAPATTVIAQAPTATGIYTSIGGALATVPTTGIVSTQNITPGNEFFVIANTEGGTLTTSAASVCAGTNTGTITLSGLATGATITGYEANTGTGFTPVSGTNTNPTYTFTNLAGTTTFRAVITTSDARTVYSAPVTVTVTPAPSAAFAYSGSTFCLSGTNPTPTITGVTGGTFSAPAGLSINATTGVINLAATTPGTYAVTYTTGGTCPGSSSNNVTITTAPVATFNYSAASFCQGGATSPTPTFPTGSSAGTFTSTTGLSINATTGAINLAASTPGTYTVTNNIAASGGCSAASATASVTITPATTAAFNYGTASSFCKTGATVTPTVSGTSGGTFASTTGLTINSTTGVITPSTSTAGTYTVTYSVGGACPSSSTQSVTITTPGTATFSYASNALCSSATTPVTPTLGTGSTAGTFTSTTGLTINATTGAITPSTSTAGTYTVTNTLPAAGGCAAVTSTAQVIINAAPATPTITQNGGTLTSSATTGNQWYLNGNIITGATGQTYVTTANGNYTVIATANGCASAASAVRNVTNTGIADALAGMSVDVYPNPATGSFNVKLNGYQKDANVVLYNLAGQKITTEKVSADGNATSISLKGLAAGTYLLKVTSEKGVQVNRLIVQ